MGIDGLATFGEGQQKPRAVLAGFRDLQRKPAAVQVGTQGGHCVVAGLGRAQTPAVRSFSEASLPPGGIVHTSNREMQGEQT